MLIIIPLWFYYSSFFLCSYLSVVGYDLVFCAATIQRVVIYKSKRLEEPFGTQQGTKRIFSTPPGPLHRVAYYGNSTAATITTQAALQPTRCTVKTAGRNNRK
jgi:hypothetical protein